jgi:2-keto-4-pentenoate hydratase
VNPPPSVDPRLVAALTTQLEQRRRTLAAGATHVGWKLGIGDTERIGDGPVVGHLTSATRLPQGARFDGTDIVALHADLEVAVEFARDVDPDDDIRPAIRGYTAALELVDLATSDEDAELIVATNIYHRAYAFAATLVDALPAGMPGALLVNGEPRARGHADDVADRLQAAARILAGVGERLRAGDRIITGSVVQVAVGPGDEVLADLRQMGSVSLSIAP